MTERKPMFYRINEISPTTAQNCSNSKEIVIKVVKLARILQIITKSAEKKERSEDFGS